MLRDLEKMVEIDGHSLINEEEKQANQRGLKKLNIENLIYI
jgi:hypothetical protein